jgi:hypothetical protein
MALREKNDGRQPLSESTKELLERQGKKSFLDKLFAALGSWRDWWNKDTRGVLIGLVITILLFGAFLLLSGCAVSREYAPRLELGMGVEVSDPVVGRDPVGIIRFNQPLIPGRLHLGFQHLSSIPDYRDRTSVNQVELIVTVPLGRMEP